MVLNLFVYKTLDARHRPRTITTKFVIGMTFSVLSMSTAGLVEIFRQDQCQEGTIINLIIQ